MKKDYTSEDVYDFLARESQHDEALWKEYRTSIMSRTTDTDFWDSLSKHLDCFRVCDECGNEDGSWEHEWIRLKSINPKYPTVVITPADAENDCTVGVFKTVLKTGTN